MSHSTLDADRTPTAPDRLSGALLAGGSLAALALMVGHPTTSASGRAARLAELAAEAPTSAQVHGGLVAALALVLVGLWALARALGGERVGARAGLVAQALATTWLSAAALISGFVVPALARAYQEQPPAELAALDAPLALAWQANQALARAGSVALAAAMLCWSVVLVRRSDRGARWLGGSGLLVGAVLVLALVTGHLRLHLHGMGLVVLACSAWNLGAAAWLVARRREEPSPAG